MKKTNMETLKEKYLVPGNLVITRDTNRWIVLQNKLVSETGYLLTRNCQDDLKFHTTYDIDFSCYDIVEVREIRYPGAGWSEFTKSELSEIRFPILWQAPKQLILSLEEVKARLCLADDVELIIK